MRKLLRILTGGIILIGLLFSITACTKTTTKTETDKFSIAFDTQKQKDPDVWEGEEKIVQKGIDGEKEITYKRVYNVGDSLPFKEDELSEKIIKKPKSQLVRIGTKPRATGKKLYVHDIELELTRIERGKSIDGMSIISGTGVPPDGLLLTFKMRNLSAESRHLNEIDVADMGIGSGDGAFGKFKIPFEVFPGNMALKGDESGKCLWSVSLNPNNQSIDPAKRLNISVKGPEGIVVRLRDDWLVQPWNSVPTIGPDKTPLSPEEYSEGGDYYLNLTDLWAGPFYGDQVSTATPEGNVQP